MCKVLRRILGSGFLKCGLSRVSEFPYGIAPEGGYTLLPARQWQPHPETAPEVAAPASQLPVLAWHWDTQGWFPGCCWGTALPVRLIRMLTVGACMNSSFQGPPWHQLPRNGSSVYLRAQVNFRVRGIGTPANSGCQDWLLGVSLPGCVSLQQVTSPL